MTIGIVVYSDGEMVRQLSKNVGIGTNNQAEYTAVITALELAKELDANAVELKSDSQLLVRQLNGEYAVRGEKIRPLFEKVTQLCQNFSRVTFTWIPREKNQMADNLTGKK